ncbi:OmpH family outer membrane protein [Spirosoma fluviale]|uniref:Periplasmic chaperone for outer membrane proteins Skp n=1 Tax=Spirosoma fluviale TaxID=1597977 RepID=A0A286G9T9_9BACT|nr:OmpH family outer membrane protein [Spirosoma fluviale]SOD91889.1 periplasmic chaperone for outer membrane proteins Skp [Spirosoma fluviale]
MKKNLVIAFAAALLLGGLNAQAQAPTATPATTASAGPLKLGYTNIDYILSQTPEAKDIQNQLTIQRTQSENEMKRMNKELEDKYEAYQKGGAQMSDVIRKDRETELQSLQTRIQEFGRTAEQSLQTKYQQLVNPVVQKIQKGIDAVAKENGYQYVFNLDAGANTIPILLVAPEENNITELVLKKLGIDPAKAAAAAKPATTGGSAPAAAKPAGSTAAPKKN